MVLVAEIILRSLGYEALHYKKYEGTERKKCMPKRLARDKYLGYCHEPGKHICYLDNKLKYTITNLQDSSRATYYNKENPKDKNRSIHLYGGSVTYGHAIHDTSTMGWIMQDALKNWHVRNYGLNGGSIVQSYLWLKRNVNNGKKPYIAILNYSSYLDMRNALIWPWRKMWQKRILSLQTSKTTFFENFHLPYATSSDHGIDIKQMPKEVFLNNLPLVKYSALMNLLNEVFNLAKDAFTDEREITDKLILKMADYCDKNGIKFIINGITNDRATRKSINYWKSKGILTNHIPIDFVESDRFNLKPNDSHPNQITNEIYAYRTMFYLQMYFAE